MRRVVLMSLFIFCLVLCQAQVKVTKKVSHDKMLERFLSYVKIESQSIDDPDINSFPISEGQKQIARLIYDEVKAMGGKDIKITLSDDYYIYIDIPSNIKNKVPSLLFMAHMDVTPEAPGKGINPIVHNNYNGGDILLPGGITISPKDPGREHLKDLVGKTIVTSDGNTLLGADDKTGCAVLISMVEELINNPKFKHGRVMVMLSQNEDVGKAAMRYEPSVFGDKPDVVIDIDGGDHNRFSIANFTATNQIYYFKGNDVHPGRAKAGKYGDARTAAAYFIGMIPPEMNPAHRDGEEGYMHCYAIEHPYNNEGKEIKTDYLVKVRLRYFDKDEGIYQKRLMTENLIKTQQAFPNVAVTKTNDFTQYENIAYTLPSFLPDMIEKATNDAKIPMKTQSKRGGTTASLIVAKFPNDIPGAPGIYSGQQSAHSRFEWACIDELLLIVNVCENLISRISEMK